MQKKILFIAAKPVDRVIGMQDEFGVIFYD